MLASWLAHLRIAERWLVHAVRFLAVHTGLPALVVAAILIVIGFRILKKSARIVVQILALSLILLAASELGWIRW